MGARESGPAPGSAPSSRGSPGVEEEAAGEGDEDEDNGEVELELLVLIFVSKPGWTDTRAGWGRFVRSCQAPPWNRFQPCTPKCGRLRGGHSHLLGLLAQQCHVDIAQNQAQVQPGSGKQLSIDTPPGPGRWAHLRDAAFPRTPAHLLPACFGVSQPPSSTSPFCPKPPAGLVQDCAELGTFCSHYRACQDPPAWDIPGLPL